MTDKPISLVSYGERTYYEYPINDFRKVRFPYVGFQNMVKVVNARSVVRMSLARWWSPDPDMEERCYVQLSGWF